ncbi:MAG: hypothetical protein IPO30_19430 [Hyphomonadaceae bacterium]|nr:hypothetical protein [Hyphomonadaceae bacterium]
MKRPREARAEAFLENPNDLLLLIDAVRSGWPTSRRELFEQAVRILASETNEFRLKKGIDVPMTWSSRSRAAFRWNDPFG